MTPQEASRKSRELCGLAPVIPVLVIDDLDHARPLAEALVRGGLPVLEVTLRTPVALEAIRIMAEVEGGVVGAGTLLKPSDVKAAVKAGAKFGVSPGVTKKLAEACGEADLPLLGGVATVTEAMKMLERGFEVCKFFPAEANGGAKALKSFAGPLPQVSFCPTGGVTPQNAPDYLKLPNVLCVGGSWVADPKLMQEGRWDEIEALAREAAALPRG
jgi:2-dehydro-3-deoxyphosphogluconate aldolase/(4S)-4-hydroxy-2-oxoglutarate aldolase